jgi:N-acetylglucosamine-6-sulfatase
MVGKRAVQIISVVALGAGLALGVLSMGSAAKPKPSRGPDGARRPNIVFVLTDDLSWNLVTSLYMPHLIQLERRGETFDHYIVADSLCCPSRSSIFTGLFPHDTGVFTNQGKDGGYFAFTHHNPDLETKTYAVAIRPAGYLTSMMGKYLNGYAQPHPQRTTHVPPGWTDWHVAGDGYREFDYYLNENRAVRYYGFAPADYLTDVLAGRATAFISRAARAHKPFVMEIATFAPHAPYTPAPRNSHDFPGLTQPRDPSFNAANTNPPLWLGLRQPLTSTQIREIDYEFRQRAQAVEAVDQLLGEVEATLAAHGLAQNTYIVFSSDNGYHMGQHRLLPGKQTAFDTDISVPLIVAGPGVPPDRVVSQVVQNVDLYPTFVQLAGGTPSSPIDGHSLLPLLHPAAGELPPWRTLALIEHHGPTLPGDPDLENGNGGGNPPDYEAIRISDKQYGNAVYVEYPTTGQREFYNIDTDPFEINNIYLTLSLAEQAQLHNMLLALENCHSASTCWAAGDPQP